MTAPVPDPLAPCPKCGWNLDTPEHVHGCHAKPAPASDDTRDRAHPAADVMREAEALLALEKQARLGEETYTNFHAALVNRAPAVIRALMERVRIAETNFEDAVNLARERGARIAALEATVRIYERWNGALRSPTQEEIAKEIAARVEENRKEQTS